MAIKAGVGKTVETSLINLDFISIQLLYLHLNKMQKPVCVQTSVSFAVVTVDVSKESARL